MALVKDALDRSAVIHRSNVVIHMIAIKPYSGVRAEHLLYGAGFFAVDAGCILPNVNDGFAGKAPDLGALQAGQPIPIYGPRPYLTQKELRGLCQGLKHDTYDDPEAYIRRSWISIGIGLAARGGEANPLGQRIKIVYGRL
jgi:hypothetical protein